MTVEEEVNLRNTLKDIPCIDFIVTVEDQIKMLKLQEEDTRNELKKYLLQHLKNYDRNNC